MRVVHLLTGSLAAGVVLVGVLATVAQTPSSVPQAAPSPATTSAESTRPEAEVLNFSLIDYNGRNHELRRAGGRAVVLYFTGVGCPIARQSAHKLQALADRFGPQGVTVWLINATPQNDPEPLTLDLMFKMGGRAPREMLGDRYPLKGMRGLVDPAVLGDVETIRKETLETLFGPAPLPPILRDRHQLVSRYLGVNRTCEAIVIDTKRQAVVYRGAVDDQFTEGARKPKPAKHYLADALDEFVTGRAVTTPRTKVHGCVITYEEDGRRADAPPVSYAREVAPILRARCVTCHSPGNIAPFAMTGYDKVKGWSAMVREVLLDRRMPPWHADPHFGKFANDRSLSGPEARTLMRWIDQGAPRGDGEDPLAAATAAAAATTRPTTAPAVWPLGAPDFVVKIPEQQIPATGVVDYRYVDSDFVMPRDAWLRAAITRPGAPQFLHHVIARVRYPSGEPETEAYLLTTWVPGLEQGEFPAGTGVFIPKGARFNFEVHYTTNGQPLTDRTEVGLYLAKEPPKMRLEVRATETRALDIPPGAPDARHTTTYAFKRDAILYELSPHMHMRGAWFRFDLLHPDGTRETLLNVPNYDFNWQNGYWLKEPRRIRAGSWLLCTGGFDNSERNPHNPDPTKRVNWGPQSWNEMFMGFMTVAEPAAK